MPWFLLQTRLQASESDRISSTVNVADADTGAAKGSSTTIKWKWNCTGMLDSTNLAVKFCLLHLKRVPSVLYFDKGNATDT
jgi:hypothetical protein